MNVREAIVEASTRIERRDAETLLLHLLHRDRAWLLAHPEDPLDAAQQTIFRAYTTRRAAREPLQYITGTQEFYGLPLRVTPDVLIPRPETEHLVEAVELWSTQFHDGRTLHIADVGTGSGAIAIALATRLAGVQLTAIDLSEDALLVALENARTHSCEDRITFLRNDLLEGFAPMSFDAIVSNPPYVPLADAAAMQAEVVRYEPHLALFAGNDGMEVYRRIIPTAHGALRCGGLLAMEFGFGQRAAMDELFSQHAGAWKSWHYTQDLQGIDRVVTALR